MTTINLFTKASTTDGNEEEWKKFVSKNNGYFIKWQNALEENLNFEVPKLHYFHDMTCFKEWSPSIKEID